MREAYALEAKLRTRGERLRLEAQLTEADGAALWTGKFDGNLDDAFDWQDKVSEEAAAHVLGEVLEAEKRRLEGRSITEMSAEECELFASLSVELVDRIGFEAAIAHSAAAIEKNPKMSDAYASAIIYYLSGEAIGLHQSIAPYRELFQKWLAASALLASKNPFLDLASGIANYQSARDRSALNRTVERVLRRAPFNIFTLTFSGWSHVWMGDPLPAVDCFEKALRLGRFGPWRLHILGGAAVASVQAGRDEAAIEYAIRGLELTQGYLSLYRALASASAHLGRMEAAREAVAAILRLSPEDSLSANRARMIGYGDTEATRRYFEGLRLAGLPE